MSESVSNKIDWDFVKKLARHFAWYGGIHSDKLPTSYYWFRGKEDLLMPLMEIGLLRKKRTCNWGLCRENYVFNWKLYKQLKQERGQ